VAILINNIISTLENKQTDKAINKTTQSKIKQTSKNNKNKKNKQSKKKKKNPPKKSSKTSKSLDKNNLKKRASDVIYFLLCHGVCV